MRSITLNTASSARWDRTDDEGVACRHSVLADAQHGANDLGETVEIYHADGHLLEALTPVYRCAGSLCPGLPWRASYRAHPGSCVGPDGY